VCVTDQYSRYKVHECTDMFIVGGKIRTNYSISIITYESRMS
jgi:hypothetical protein